MSMVCVVEDVCIADAATAKSQNSELTFHFQFNYYSWIQRAKPATWANAEEGGNRGGRIWFGAVTAGIYYWAEQIDW
jgi:hypothetical protein